VIAFGFYSAQQNFSDTTLAIAGVIAAALLFQLARATTTASVISVDAMGDLADRYIDLADP
jgi:hypothetical protein